MTERQDVISWSDMALLAGWGRQPALLMGVAPPMEIANTTATARFVGRCEPCAWPFAVDDPGGGSDHRKVVCPECDATVVLSRIHGITTTMVCTGACVDATGPVCECACGGANHAGSYLETAPMLADAIERFRANLARRQTAVAKAAARRAAARASQRASAVQRWRDEHPAEAAWLDANWEHDVFAASAAHQLDVKGTLSAGQTDAIARCLERQAEEELRELEHAAEAAAAVAAPEGTVAVEGDILAVRVEPSRFHYGSEIRMLVRATAVDGGIYRVWATKPAGLSTAGRGDRVRFVAELTRSENDETFAYAKRPRKAYRLISPASRSATPSPSGGPPPPALPVSVPPGAPVRETSDAVATADMGAGRASQERLPW